MKIPIKLKASEVHSLINEFERVLKPDESTDRMEAIIVTLMVKFYQKLKQKSILIDKPAITINVEPETAMAFVEFFCDYPIDCYTHAGNTVQKLIANYDKQTANFF